MHIFKTNSLSDSKRAAPKSKALNSKAAQGNPLSSTNFEKLLTTCKVCLSVSSFEAAIALVKARAEIIHLRFSGLWMKKKKYLFWFWTQK